MGHPPALTGDAFYENEVGPRIRESDIDKWFQEIRVARPDDLVLHVEVHARVMGLFSSISGLEKRSLASKYLHFHFPDRFYIYDSRAKNVISKLTKPIGRKLSVFKECDPEYARFCLRARDLHQEFTSLLGRPLSMRAFDKVLLVHSRAADLTTVPDKVG